MLQWTWNLDTRTCCDVEKGVHLSCVPTKRQVKSEAEVEIVSFNDFLCVTCFFNNHDGRGRNSSQPLFAFESCSFQLLRVHVQPNYLVDFIQPGFLCFIFEGQEILPQKFPQSGNCCFLERQQLGWTFHVGQRVTPLDNICIHHSSWTLLRVVISYERKKMCVAAVFSWTRENHQIHTSKTNKSV